MERMFPIKEPIPPPLEAKYTFSFQSCAMEFRLSSVSFKKQDMNAVNVKNYCFFHIIRLN